LHVTDSPNILCRHLENPSLSPSMGATTSHVNLLFACLNTLGELEYLHD
jgi:hypothetical protein